MKKRFWLQFFSLILTITLALATIQTVFETRAIAQKTTSSPVENTPLQLERANAPFVYFSYRGKPLLSFGGLSDFIFYAAPDAYDYKRWADWATDRGMNHLRAYPPMSWKHIEFFTQENGGSLDNVLFPYRETHPGSRQFDLTQFNEAYWQRFRQQCEYLQSKGIIIHLLTINGWQFDNDELNWKTHFFHPDNNINTFTDPLAENRFAFYHSVADDRPELVAAQKAWLQKLVEVTADLDNVYYDLVHEMSENYRDWSKIQPWIDEMATTVRDRYRELQPDKPIILGMDTGGLKRGERHWVFSRSYFDLLIYGKYHTIDNAKAWRIGYKKPYIPQESWDDNQVKYGYREPQTRIATRKYMWKFVMAKCQQLDLYIKPRKGREQLPGYDHNYDPRGWNEFENDAPILRQFWESLTDYPNLWFVGNVRSGPGSHQYVLSSPREAIAYLSSDTEEQDINFPAQALQLTDLDLVDGEYTAELVKPDRGVLATQKISVTRGKVSMDLPEFTDDLAIHLYRDTVPANAPFEQSSIDPSWKIFQPRNIIVLLAIGAVSIYLVPKFNLGTDRSDRS